MLDAIDAGPLGGLYTALISAPVGQVIVLAGGMPCLTARFLEGLFERGVEGDAVVPRTAEGAEFDPEGALLLNVKTRLMSTSARVAMPMRANDSARM